MATTDTSRHPPDDPLSRLPTPSERRIAVRISADALRQVRGGHPWIFDGSIDSVSHDGSAGDLAVVFDGKRRFAAVGLFDPTSPIRVRVLHAGDPRAVDEDFWRDRIESALARRAELTADPETTAYRVIHGENDGLPGLIVDRYADVAVVKIYTAAWLPHLRSIVPVLVEATGVDHIVLRHGRSVDVRPHLSGPVTTLVGQTPNAAVEFLERGLRFEADVVAGQKTGHFLDQRENRVLVGGLSEGARVLDVFCCTGGFSVHAAAGGAASVLSVDQSGPALATARRNMARNDHLASVERCDHATAEGDAFTILDTLAREKRRFDVVVVDPPSFASRADQLPRVVAAYSRLARMAVALVTPGGMLVQSSCSSRVDEALLVETIRTAAHDAGHGLEEWARTGHAVDHPVGFPEGRYLKTLFARVR